MKEERPDGRMRGDGFLYRPPGTRFYHFQFSLNGQRVRGSTAEIDEMRALRVLRRKMDQAKRGDAVPHEERVTVADLFRLIEDNYKLRRNRSLATMCYSFRHLLAQDQALPVRVGNGRARSRTVEPAQNPHRSALVRHPPLLFEVAIRSARPLDYQSSAPRKAHVQPRFFRGVWLLCGSPRCS